MSVEVVVEKKMEVCCEHCGSKLQFTKDDIVKKSDYIKTGWLTGFYHNHNIIVCPVCKFETWAPTKAL